MSLLAALPTLKATIDAHGLGARKALGQHFLLDANIVRRIASYAGDLDGRTAIEIGPGPGGLTRALLESNAARVVAIEKDERFLLVLAQLKEAAGERFIVAKDDALRHDLLHYPAPRKIVANLPYNVGTELLVHWLEDIAKDSAVYESMTLMFQKEVAERITATHGSKDYGRLSVFAQWLCKIRYDMELPPGAFSPPPKVSSAVVTLTPRKTPLFPAKKETLEKLLAKAFGQRRKMLRSALKGIIPDMESFFAESGIDPTLRAEQVDIAGFGRMAAVLELRDKIG
ncbi:MAG: 16S rRNA (adenine(1518)-N(6)/adenine(1519)-N(6))-dimethyltransferase RsmA [Alphaproteobacteria bacterium]|nr:16S rRNA (adenine(1518)-N(6)/adenine(1519)-N(6))-dimethyltransferase RsmA [Alphaproteobacteria bacterium]